MKFRYHYPQLLLLLAAAKFLTAPINPRDNQRRGGLSFNFPSKALYCVISCVVPQREVTSANRESLSPPSTSKPTDVSISGPRGTDP